MTNSAISTGNGRTETAYEVFPMLDEMLGPAEDLIKGPALVVSLEPSAADSLVGREVAGSDLLAAEVARLAVGGSTFLLLCNVLGAPLQFRLSFCYIAGLLVVGKAFCGEAAAAVAAEAQGGVAGARGLVAPDVVASHGFAAMGAALMKGSVRHPGCENSNGVGGKLKQGRGSFFSEEFNNY